MTCSEIDRLLSFVYIHKQEIVGILVVCLDTIWLIEDVRFKNRNHSSKFIFQTADNICLEFKRIPSNWFNGQTLCSIVINSCKILQKLQIIVKHLQRNQRKLCKNIFWHSKYFESYEKCMAYWRIARREMQNGLLCCIIFQSIKLLLLQRTQYQSIALTLPLFLGIPVLVQFTLKFVFFLCEKKTVFPLEITFLCRT